MDPIKLLQKYYNVNTLTYQLLIEHGHAVMQKALFIAHKLNNIDIDIQFIKEAAILHDIGVYDTYKPEIGCNGKYDYVCHGYLGREILEKEGLIRHALVAERHVGVGITIDEIMEKKLPLPLRNMIPLSIEEKIICYADKFFSKIPGMTMKERTIEEIEKTLEKYGLSKVNIFRKWNDLFN